MYQFLRSARYPEGIPGLDLTHRQVEEIEAANMFSLNPKP